MTLFTRTLRALALPVLAGTLLVACSKDEPVTPPTNTTVSTELIDTVLRTASTDVILATYTDLDLRAGELKTAVEALHAAPSTTTLDAARQAWRNARRPWEQSEGFLFGPVDEQGIDPSIDDWPVNYVDLDAVMADSGTALTKAYVDGLETTLKGFHTIEYLLFGNGGTKTINDFTPRQFEYLIAVTESFRGKTSQLYMAWSPSGQNFADTIAKAGASFNTRYTSRSQALQELVTGMAGICNEVATGKIAEPFTLQDRTKEESQFSNNSNTDFADNIRSVKNIYLGTYNGAGSSRGLHAIVAARNPTLDARIRTEIDDAIAAIDNMTPSFGVAIFSNKSAVEAAQAAIQKVKLSLESEVMPIMQAL